MRADLPGRLPSPRGPLTDALFDAWQGHGRVPLAGLAVPAALDDPLTGDEFHLALYCCYELHYRGFEGVDDEWERDPAVIALAATLEDAFEAALRAEVAVTPLRPDNVEQALWDLAHGDGGGPSLSAYVADHASIDQVRELAVHRSAYQRKEADPHSWALPRLSGRAKAALVEIQADEYGEGVPGRSHAELFADTMTALGLDPTYGAYLESLPGVTLATTNLISLFGRQRRLRGALVGHLALFEMTSVGPMGRYSRGLDRLGVDGAEFYDVHVEADAHHQHVGAHDLAQALADDEPEVAPDILFGATALGAVEARFAGHVLDAWDRDESSLRPTASRSDVSAAS